ALGAVSRPRRTMLVGVFGALLLLLLGSDASYAVARNLPLGRTLMDRAPGVGPWLEGLVLAGPCALVASRSNLSSLGLSVVVRRLRGVVGGRRWAGGGRRRAGRG